MTEDEMVGWHHQLNGHGFGWTPGVGGRQGGLVCCSLWGCKESDMTKRPTLCDPVKRSMPGLPVDQQLPQFTQTHVH